jgi:hypothetical protein
MSWEALGNIDIKEWSTAYSTRLDLERAGQVVPGSLGRLVQDESLLLMHLVQLLQRCLTRENYLIGGTMQENQEGEP